MVRQKEAKTSALLTAIVIVILSFININDWAVVGISKGGGLLPRCIYPFFHVSPLHAVVNAWCLICIVFRYDVSVRRLLIAYSVGIIVPGCFLSEVPTVGFSCICYFLIGTLLFEVKRKLYFLFCTLSFIVFGALFTSVNAMIHIYGYLAGLTVGLLNTPLTCFRK